MIMVKSMRDTKKKWECLRSKSMMKKSRLLDSNNINIKRLLKKFAPMKSSLMVRVKLIMLMDNGTPEVKKNNELAKVIKNKGPQRNKTIIVNWKVLMRLSAKTSKESNGSTSKFQWNFNKVMTFTSKRLETTGHQRLWFLLRVVDSEQVIQEDLIMRLKL